MTQWKDPAAVRREKAWRILRPMVATLLSVVLVVLAMTGAVRYVLSHFVYPVDADDNTPIEVVIPNGASASRIASILYTARGADEPGLIVSTASFKVYVDFTGRSSALKAGTYVLSRNMTIPEKPGGSPASPSPRGTRPVRSPRPSSRRASWRIRRSSWPSARTGRSCRYPISIPCSTSPTGASPWRGICSPTPTRCTRTPPPRTSSRRC